MRVAILTSIRHGLASRCLPALVEHPQIEVAVVVHCRAHYKSPLDKVRRKLKKVRQIGPLGVLTGLWIRNYYNATPAEDLFVVARRLGVPVAETPRTNAPETQELLRESGADLGLSLGNSYLARRVYSVPRFGMLNVHGELLPRFQGAASVIWAIHEGVSETGLTIHEVDRGIDTGRILYQERFPITFRRTLKATVRANAAEISRRVPAALTRVVADYESHAARGQRQSGDRSYTTPTFWQFLRMLRQHRRMRASAPSG